MGKKTIRATDAKGKPKLLTVKQIDHEENVTLRVGGQDLILSDAETMALCRTLLKQLRCQGKYQKSKQLVAKMQTVSISLLQREFGVDYNTAGDIMARLEENGHVSAPDENGQCKVIIKQGEPNV